MMYDYIVVGAGPAGCVCAGELKKKNYSVCVLEKQPEHYRKVCGDGISYVCVQALRSIDFPIESLMDAGAVKIQRYIHYVNGKMYEDRIGDYGKEAYGLARDKTDAAFRQYFIKDRDIPLYYNRNAGEIRSVDQGYEVCGIKAKRLVLAAGALAKINLDGKALLRPDAGSPVGISAILQADAAGSPFFLFDYRAEYEGTYGWIFRVGEREYNVGLWLKREKHLLAAKFQQFLETRVEEYLGFDYQWRRKPRGAIMGIGNRRVHTDDSIVYLGDASNTSNPEDGEGISLAVKDALDFTGGLK